MQANLMASKKVKILSNKERLKAAKLVVDSKLSIASVARNFDASEQAISRAVKRKNELEEGINNDTINPNRKRIKNGMCPEIEEQLIKWIEVVRVWKIPLTRHAIQVCALQLFSERNESNEKSFKASRGWFNGFKSRYCLHIYRLVGEATSSKVNDYFVELGKISLKIAEYTG